MLFYPILRTSTLTISFLGYLESLPNHQTIIYWIPNHKTHHFLGDGDLHGESRPTVLADPRRRAAEICISARAHSFAIQVSWRFLCGVRIAEYRGVAGEAGRGDWVDWIFSSACGESSKKRLRC